MFAPRSLAVLTGLLLFAPPGRVAHGQAPPLAATLRELKSDVDTVRMKAFYRLIEPGPDAGASTRFLLATRPADRNRIALALIALLQREHDPRRPPLPDSLSEAFAEYDGDLIWAVGELHDRRAVPALIGAIETGGLAERGLVSLGSAAVPALIQTSRTGSMFARQGATSALGMVAARQVELGLDAKSIESVRGALLGALGDDRPFVRYEAVNGLAPFRDPEVTAAIQRMAARDTAHDVRQAAAAQLRTRAGGRLPR